MPDKTLHYIFDKLSEENYSLVVSTSSGNILSFRSRGVIDLYRLLTNEPENLFGALIADKAVGLGAAVLMILGRIAAVKTPVISREAVNLLEKHGIKVYMDTVVPYIINRAGTGRCPLEERLSPLQTENLDTYREVIKQFLIEKNLL